MKYSFSRFLKVAMGAIVLFAIYFYITRCPTLIPIKPLLIIILGIVILKVMLSALTRISQSRMNDGIKFCWVVLVLILPILGSVSALIVIKEELVEPAH